MTAVMSYEKFVPSLTNDLKEAMVNAQVHATKEQNRHIPLYNKRVKGSNIKIAHRVHMVYSRGREPMAREPNMALPVTAYGSQTILSWKKKKSARPPVIFSIAPDDSSSNVRSFS